MLSLEKEEIINLRKKVLEKEFQKMNDKQKEAVFLTEGAVLILAGAGSGKTTVVINRIANIIKYGRAYHSGYVSNQLCEEDIEAMQEYLENGQELSESTVRHMSVMAPKTWKILAITFTNKAAKELKTRIEYTIGETARDVWASTFHSTCARILRQHGERLGYSSHFTIYDTSDTRALIKNCLKMNNIEEKTLSPKSIISAISSAKDDGIEPDEYIKSAMSDYRKQQIGKVYKSYQEGLKSSNAMDFDDLIVNTVKLFETCPDVLEYYNNRFEYVMVDEYQDTNKTQYKLVKLLSGTRQNLCVVGDDDQSIYKFRGATIENILSFENNFSQAKIIRLEQNYRSTSNILNASNGVISHNKERKGKNLWTDKGDGEPITIHKANDESDEAKVVANEILKQVAKGKEFSDFAILYRMNSQSLSFEREFSRQGIPHRILGGTRFFDRAEIKDMVSYLCVINNPNDITRTRRIINVPTRGIGAKTIEILQTIFEQTGMNYLDIIRNNTQFPILSKYVKKLQVFLNIMDELIEYSKEHTINELYLKLLEITDYANYIKADDDKIEEKRENLQQLSSNIVSYEEECEENENKATLSNFLEEISLISDIDNYNSEAKAVTLMTVHSAKGLEFPTVFLPGWEESIFPSANAQYFPEELEEERRLAYVAITRAKEKLFILHADRRMVFGSTSRNPVSRFIKEIPENLTDRKSTVQEGPFIRQSNFNPTIMPSVSSQYKQPASTPKVTYKAGDAVTHKTFGQGMIISTRPLGNDVLLEIAFSTGTKLLAAKFVNLTKI